MNPRARYSGISCERIVAEESHSFVRKISPGSVQRIGISPNGALVPGVTIVQSSADIALSDARLYVLDSRRVRVFDAAHADTFPHIAEFAVPSGMGGMRVENHTMVLKGDGLVLLDVTDPAAPEPLSRLPRCATAYRFFARLSVLPHARRSRHPPGAGVRYSPRGSC